MSSRNGHRNAAQRGSGQRRGLGRGLGSLIPTSAEAEAANENDATSDAASDAVTDAATGPTASGSRDHDTGAGGAEGGQWTPSVVAGLPELPGGSEAVPSGAYFAELPPDQIRPNHAQPRSVFDEDAMAELVVSIREVGLLQPVVVRPLGSDGYELVMGERRWRAAREAGLDAIPAIVRQTDDDDMLRDALLENLHRAQLNPLEEASAYAQLLEDFGCTHEELATRIGRSRPQITNTLRLLKLSPAVQRRVAVGVLSAGHARALLGVDDGERQDRLAQRVVAEGISVRGLEELVALSDETEGGAVGPDGSGIDLRRRPVPVAPGLADIAERLGDRLETRVKVDLGKTKGKVTIEFATLDDLRRITEIIDPSKPSDSPTKQQSN